MPRDALVLKFQSLIAGLITLSALMSCFLLIADLGERLRFDRVIVELALLAPLTVWLLRRRLHLHH